MHYFIASSLEIFLNLKILDLTDFYIKTTSEAGKKISLITFVNSSNKKILEKVSLTFLRIMYDKSHNIESHNIIASKLIDPKSFTPWHEKLGYLKVFMLCRIIDKFIGHPYKDLKVFSKNDSSCLAFSL